jgi:hypothetical protein
MLSLSCALRMRCSRCARAPTAGRPVQGRAQRAVQQKASDGTAARFPAAGLPGCGAQYHRMRFSLRASCLSRSNSDACFARKW